MLARHKKSRHKGQEQKNRTKTGYKMLHHRLSREGGKSSVLHHLQHSSPTNPLYQRPPPPQSVVHHINASSRSNPVEQKARKNVLERVTKKKKSKGMDDEPSSLTRQKKAMTNIKEL